MKTQPLILVSFLLGFSFAAPGSPIPSYYSPSSASLIPIRNITKVVTRTTTVCPTSSSTGYLPALTATSSAPSDHLLPCVHQDFDTHAIENLVPNDTCTLYYEAQSAAVENAAAFVVFSGLRYPTVILEHVSYVTSTVCSGDTLTIAFSDTVSLTYAADAWSKALPNGLMVVTNCPTCGTGYPAERSWLLVKEIQDSGSRKISCKFSQISLEDASTVVEVNFGRNQRPGYPSGGPGNNSHSFSSMWSGPSYSSTSSVLSSAFASSSASLLTKASTSSKSPLAPSAQTTSSQLADNPGLPSSFSTNPIATGNLFATSTGSVPSASPTDFIDFDVALDDSIGYLDPNAPGFWNQLLPGIPNLDTTQFGTANQKLVRRAWNIDAIGNTLNQAAQNAITVAGDIVGQVSSAVNSATNAFSNTVSDAVQSVLTTLGALSPFSLGPFPFNFAPKNSVRTPFGDGVVITQNTAAIGPNGQGSITAYCIGCSVSGSFKFTGNFKFDVQQGLIQAVVDLVGDLHAQLIFSLIGEISGSTEAQTNLITQGIPGLSITNLISVGPSVSLDIGGTVDIKLQAGIEYGYHWDWPAIDAHIDLVNPSARGATGFQPVVTPKLEFSETATLDTTLYGLISLRFGVNVLRGKFRADVGLVDKPEVDLTAAQHIYSQNELAQLKDGDIICGGVGVSISLLDTVYADAVWGGLGSKKNRTTTWPLTKWNGPSTSYCVGQSSTILHKTTSSSGSASSDSTASASTSSPVSACGFLQDGGESEPDDDGDDIYTCTDASLLVPSSNMGTPTPSATTTSTSSAPSFSPSSCGPNLDQSAFIACESSVEAAIQSFEASVFGIGRRSVKTSMAATITATPILATPTAKPRPRAQIKKRDNAPIEVVSIVSLKNSSLMLSWADNGNVIVNGDASDNSFSSIKGSIIGDSSGQRLLHMYTDTMAQLGVSRLRLAAIDMMPMPSVLVTITPINIGHGRHVYIAVTSAGDFYFLVTCLLDAQFPKVFLARDLAAGISTLQDPALQDTLVGGAVTQCGYVPWAAE